ncbi:SMC-Scp complex subunit ScpB [Spiroplasma endosymbiont of Glossina fuscipes fuscipes]|uniref:SMC-Scp complex subunit ScpB n=1 Tax=Spiroplasma endosymbiont of Glossina fuscipes fuscipes TaxID=2004463 RepID=UPI003C75938E
MNLNEKIALLEGLLFISGDEGISLKEIAHILEISEAEVDELLLNLKTEYQTNKMRGLTITAFADKYRLTTKKEYYSFYLKLANNKNEARLSQAALETLAIIAYRGPISKPEIEELRGVNSDNVIQKLRARELIEEAGKSELPGKPMTYQITNEFLKVFNLTSLADLPQIKEAIIDNDQDLFK